jgi:hypothetical protein
MPLGGGLQKSVQTSDFRAETGHSAPSLRTVLRTGHDSPHPLTAQEWVESATGYNRGIADDDLFVDKDDRMEVDPNDLGPIFTRVVTLQLAKKMSKGPKTGWAWTKEEELQEVMSSLLASCNGRGRNSIRVIVTRKEERQEGRQGHGRR